MSSIIIEQLPKVKKEARTPEMGVLYIAEFFTDTIQGEGVLSGYPAAFLRMKNCTLQCNWCDTLSVWKHGNPYSIDEFLDIIEENDVHKKLETQHLILTGGSPLLHQSVLVTFINSYIKRFGYKPFIQVENECILPVMPEFDMHVDYWNNSPKTSNSGMKKYIRYKPDILKEMNKKENASFKFVISSEDDWKEIEEDFIKPELLDRHKIILMPEGSTREELQNHYQICVDIALREHLVITDRLQVTFWNLTTSV